MSETFYNLLYVERTSSFTRKVDFKPKTSYYVQSGSAYGTGWLMSKS